MKNKLVRLVCMLVTIVSILVTTSCTKTSEVVDETSTAVVTTTAKPTTTTPKATTSTTTKQSDTTRAVEENPFAEFFEVSWIWGFCDTYKEGAFDEILIEEKFNIDFDVWNISYYDREGITMMLAAGDIPDFSVLAKSPFNPKYLYDEGFTRSIHVDMYKQYFPYYYDLMIKNAPSSFQGNNIPGTEEYYGVSSVKYLYKHFYNMPLFRLDWLENVGYAIPESELTPIVLTDEKLGKYSEKVFVTNYMFEHEELNDIFRAFTEDDPDGNGEDDTYAAVIYPHTSIDFFHEIYWGMFGVTPYDPNYLYNDRATGDVVPFYAYSGYKDYMIWANEMHEKGYMRTTSGEGAWKDVLFATWMTGKVGFFTADRQYIMKPDLPAYSDKQPPQCFYLNGEDDSTFVAMPVLKGPGSEGTWGNRRYSLDAFVTSTGATWLVSKTVSDNKLARILSMWNDMYTNWESEYWDKIIYGIEGVHFKWSGEPFQSARLLQEESKIPPQYRKAGYWGHYAFNKSLPKYDTEAYRTILLMQEENKWMEKYALNPCKYINVIYMDDDMFKEYTTKSKELSSSINTIVTEFATRSWNGEIGNIDSEWSEYIDQLYKAGLEELIDKYYNNDKFKTYQIPDLS